MSNKDLLKQAIAEAKTIREAAIANAKEALEESLTPHLKDMLAAKLQEMEDADDMDEIVNEEEVINNPEGETAHGNVAEAEEEEEESEEEAGEEEGEEAEEEAGEEEDLEIEDMSVEDLKDLIRGIVSQEMGNEEEIPGEESAEELGAEDMTGMDAEEEEIDINELLAELEESEEEGMEEGIKDFAKKAGDAAEKAIDYVGDKLHGGKGLGLTKGAFNEGEIEEGLADEMKALAAKYGDAFEKWIDSVGDKLHGGKGLGLNKPGGPGPNEAMEDDLAEALATVETLRGQLQEVNLLNAKLLYVNKVFKSNNLSENQKVNVIAAFDKAETVKEVKLVFETVSKNVVAKPAAIKEHKSFASKATGTTARPANPEIISEVSETVKRMQKLAGII